MINVTWERKSTWAILGIIPQVSSVDIVAMLQGFNPGRAKRFFSNMQYPDWLWGPTLALTGRRAPRA
jgi:hypothetical protein